MSMTDDQLASKLEPFDSFWEAPTDIEKGYSKFHQFYKCNYLPYIPQDRKSRILVISCRAMPSERCWGATPTAAIPHIGTLRPPNHCPMR